MKRVVYVIIAAIFAFTLLCASGCGAEPDTQSAPPPADTVPAKKFAMIVKAKDNPYMLKMFEGFETACREIGIEAVFMGPDSYTAEAQVGLIEEAVKQGVSAIAIAANHTDALEGPLKRAMDAGICVVSLDSSVNPQSRIVHIQQADPEKVGRVLIQAANKMVGGKGKAAIITSTPFASNQNLWLSWMKKEYSENPLEYRNFVLLEDRYGEDSAEITRKKTIELLEQNPDMGVIITPSVVSMKAVGQVLKERGSKVLFTGLGLPSEMAEYIEEGYCEWMYLWNPIELGYLTAYTSSAIVSGEIAAKLGDTFSAGHLGIRSVDESADGGTEVLLGDPMKFDKDNINQWKSVY